MLLDRTHYSVKRIMGSFGWRNDFDGANDAVLRETARFFRRDLVYVGERTIHIFGEELPSAIVTVPSLNYTGKFHGVVRLGREVIDPNFGHPTRKYWSADASLEEMKSCGALVLTREVLSDVQHKRLKHVRNTCGADKIREEILRVAA